MFPIRLGTNIADTLSKLISFNLETLTCKVASSTSTNKGTKLLWTIGNIVVEKVNAGVMTFYPSFNLNDNKAKRLADEPLFTINPKFLL